MDLVLQAHRVSANDTSVGERLAFGVLSMRAADTMLQSPSSRVGAVQAPAMHQ
jgi:hypothetical protein